MPSTAMRSSPRPNARPPSPHGDGNSSSSPLHFPARRASLVCSGPGLGVSIVVSHRLGMRCYCAAHDAASTLGMPGFPVVAPREKTGPDQIHERARLGAQVLALAHDDAV